MSRAKSLLGLVWRRPSAGRFRGLNPPAGPAVVVCRGRSGAAPGRSWSTPFWKLRHSLGQNRERKAAIFGALVLGRNDLGVIAARVKNVKLPSKRSYAERRCPRQPF